MIPASPLPYAATIGVAAPAPALRKLPWLDIARIGAAPIRIPVRIEGVPARALVDSGSCRTVIDEGFAQRARLQTGADIALRGLTAAVDVQLGQKVDIDVGGVRLRNVEPVMLDLSSLAKTARSGFDLILGHDLFLAATLDIDFGRDRMRLLPAWTPLPGGEGHIGLMRSDENLLCAPVTIEEGTCAQAAIDLGSMVPLYVSPDFAAENDLLAGGRWSTAMHAGAEGAGIARTARLSSISLAGTRLLDVPIAVPDQWTFSVPIIVGLPVLARFHAILAFGQGTAHFSPGGNMDAPFPRDRSGLNVIGRADRLDVMHVARRSPAEALGLTDGDQIVAIDGVPISPSYLEQHRGMGIQPPGTTYRLTLIDGRRVELILTDYY